MGKYKITSEESEPWNEKEPGVVYATPKDWEFATYDKHLTSIPGKKSSKSGLEPVTISHSIRSKSTLRI